MGKNTRKKRKNLQNFRTKSILEFIQGWKLSKLHAYSLEHLPRNSLVMFLSIRDSSLFQNWLWNFLIFGNYIIADYVFGHDVIGQPDIESDNFGIVPFNTEIRLAIDGLDKKYWSI